MIINDDIESLFFGNYFCLMEKHNAAFVAISKNAVTLLKNIAIYDNIGYVPEKEEETHGRIGYSLSSEYLYSKEQLNILEQKTGPILKFAIWRDPVERLISCYKFFCLEHNDRNYFRYLNLFHDNSFDRFMEFVVFELGKSNPLYQDEHIRKQSDYYKQSDVDYIVAINKLEPFLQEHNIPSLSEKFNKTQVYFNFPKDKWESRIKELYSDDYNLVRNY